jgi:hypothetical protein
MPDALQRGVAFHVGTATHVGATCWSMSWTGVAVLAAVLVLGGCTSGDSGGPVPPICPMVLPEMGSACAPPGVDCRYARSANSCALACACLGGSWNCEPACVAVFVADATGDGG